MFLTTPALLILPLIRYAGTKAENPRIQNAVQAVVFASAGLLWAATVPLAREAVVDAMTFGIMLVGVGLLWTGRVDSLWVVVGDALVYLSAASVHIVAGP